MLKHCCVTFVRRMLVAGALTAALAADALHAQVGQPAPDGTIIQCAFALTIYESLSGDGSYKVCGGYEFSSVGAPFNHRRPAEGELRISTRGGHAPMTFRFADIPLAHEGLEIPTRLLDHGGTPTRVVVIRRADKIDIMVGTTPFTARLPVLKAKQ